MTTLSVNLNKIALLRNSRGRNYPDLIAYTRQLLELGVKGITVHPRPDERHVTRRDVYALRDFLADHPRVEFNIEGYPSEEFLALVLDVRPAQCTLVPDSPEQLTSDHGWDITTQASLLKKVLPRLRDAGIRSSLFIDPDPEMVARVPDVAADRIELYTEAYAADFHSPARQATWEKYYEAARRATDVGLGINAGHDLDLGNLAGFLEIPNILEVSIGHALVVEAIQMSLPVVISKYLRITGG